MTWLVLQQMSFEGPALIGEVAAARGLELRIIRTDSGEPVPSADSVEAYEGLIVLGGAMGALDDDAHPALAAERALVAAAIDRGVPVLGMCLGAQIIALAAGAELRRGDESEDGLGTVELTDAGRDDPVIGPAGPTVPVFHWHEDTMTLPEGAVLLASNENYPHQAFRLGRTVYGFQFHLEMGPDQLAGIADELPADADRDPERARAVERVGRGVFERYFVVVEAERATRRGADGA